MASPLGKKSQIALVRDHLKNKGSITAIEAAALYRIRSLSRRINDVEALGYSVRREWHKDLTGQRYVRYSQLRISNR